MVGPRPGGPRRARRPDALERSERPRTSRRVAAAVRRSHPARVARVGLRHRSHGPLGGGGWRNQEDCERQRPQAAGRTTRPGRRPDDAGHVRRLRVELGVEGHARCEQRRQVQRVGGALHGAGAQPRCARVRVPDPRRRSPPRWSAAEPPGRSPVRPFPTEREETPEAGRRVEPLHSDLPRESWRALVERRADRGIRSRHGADGFGPCGQQVPLDPGVRHAPQGAHCPSGPRRRSLFPQYQGSGPMKRRKFLKTASAAGFGLAAARSPLFGLARSPNDKVVVAVMGLNGRGTVLARGFARTAQAEVASVCDVDAVVLAKGVSAVAQVQGKSPKGLGDFRKALEDKDVDALVIAAPDHWHTPAALLAMQAGKHVYVEKPCGHNPREGELLVEAQQKHKRVVQMGTQQRSAPRSMEVVQAIKEGAIGQPYLARAWYANTRATIGRGKPAPVPANLDYELWQGPAPHTPYRDNVIHYNWHWFRRWGTGEICNNGTHEIDVARWALGVDFPVRVTSVGGRYHFDDDWEFPDTQDAGFEFEGQRAIVWQGLSCNPFPTQNRSRGTIVHGTTGSVVLDQDGYTVYDLESKVVKESIAPAVADPLAPSGDDQLTGLHLANFVAAIRTGAVVNQPIEEGAKSVLLCHLGNIAQWTGRALRTDPRSGRILGDEQAMSFWQREYAPGWAPVV